MDPHPLANLSKLAACCKPVAKNEEVIKNAIGIHLLNEKHDCNCVSENSMNDNCANDHDWGDNYDVSCDLVNYEPHNELIDDKNCNTIKSGFGRASTLGNNDPATLKNYQSCHFFYKSGFGEVMTLVDVNPTFLEDYKTFMHVDHEEKILYEIYIVEFDYDPTCNYFERGKYGCRNFHVTKLPPVMLRLSMFYSSLLHMLDISYFDNLFAYKMPMHRKYVRLKCACHIFLCSLCASILVFDVSIIEISKPVLMAIKEELVGRQPNSYHLYIFGSLTNYCYYYDFVFMF